MAIRHVVSALVLIAAGAGFLHHGGPGTAIAAGAADDVIVVITLTEQPALHVMSAMRPADVQGSPEERDAVDARLQRAALERIAGIVGPAQERIGSEVRARGGAVLYRLRGYGALVAKIPRVAWKQLAELPGVRSVELESQYRHAQDLTAATMMVFPPQGLRDLGAGSVDLAIVDTGLRVGHPAFSSRAQDVYSRIFHNSARLQSDYSDDYLDPDDYQGHGTSVTGVLFAPGLDWLSHLPHGSRAIDHIYNLKAAYRARDGASHATQGDVMTAIDASLGFADPPEVINYSYGSDAVVDDDGYCRFFDSVVDSFGKVLTLSAGNAGLRALGTPGIAHNVISIANVNDQGTVDRDDDVIAPTSSAGPTPGGRKKPDLAALGSHISTASRSGGFAQVTGTSFAAPAIAAAAAVLIDAGTADPRAVKAVMINSADDFGAPGWDIDFGWGYFNALRAQQQRQQYVIDTVGPSLRRRFFSRTAPAQSKATLVWNRHITQAGSYLNDLDLYLYDEASGMLREASVSAVDNVEQVTSEDSGAAVLVVDSGERVQGTEEPFALAHSGGFIERRGPDVDAAIAPFSVTQPGGVITVEGRVTNSGDLRGHGFTASLRVPAGFSIVGDSRRRVGTLDAGESTLVTWKVRVPAQGNIAGRFELEARAQAYGATWLARTVSSIED